MPTYKISYEQLRQQPEIREMLAALERGFAKFGIDFYLVGAVARDVWMSGIHGIAPRRTTADIDFAVLIQKKDDFTALTDYLVQAEGFRQYRENPFVLLWKDRTEVDLMPFGALADETGRVALTGIGFTTLQVPGFQEVYEAGLPELELAGTHHFKFCTLPGIVLLKLIAWDDRPEARQDDIKDISDILNHFFEMYAEEIYEKHLDLFGQDTISLLEIACRVMGREMSKIARRNPGLNERIENILQANVKAVTGSRMGAVMTSYFKNTVAENVILLKQIEEGFKEKSNFHAEE